MKTNSIKRLFFVLLMPVLISSCETEDSGTGNYVIGVSNASSKTIQMQIILDGESQGVFFVKAGQQGNYGSLCNDLVYAATLDNVRVLTYVAAGSHTLKLKDYDSGKVYWDISFKLEGDQCGAQQFNLN